MLFPVVVGIIAFLAIYLAVRNLNVFSIRGKFLQKVSLAIDRNDLDCADYLLYLYKKNLPSYDKMMLLYPAKWTFSQWYKYATREAHR